MDEGDLYFSPVLSDSYREDFSRSPSSDGDFSTGIDFGAFELSANPFEFDNPWGGPVWSKQHQDVVAPTESCWLGSAPLLQQQQPQHPTTPPTWKMEAAPPSVVFKTEAAVVPPVSVSHPMVPATMNHVAAQLPFFPTPVSLVQQQLLQQQQQLQQLQPSSPQHRGKRRKLESDKEVVTLTPPSTPPYVTASGEARLDLSREELLALTSEQFEDLVGQVRTSRDLTPAEKREIKKQRRLIKNRESAHASRQRKKDYVSELEKKLADLSRENVRLTQVISAMQGENALLRSENQLYKGRGQLTSYIPETIQRGVSYLSQQLQVQQQQQQQLQNQLLQPNFPATSIAQLPPQPSMTRAKSPNKTSGVLLMVLLFSFGVMFGNLGFSTPTSPISTQAAPEVVPRVFQREEFEPLSRVSAADLPEHEVSDMMRERLRRRTIVEPLSQDEVEIPSSTASVVLPPMEGMVKCEEEAPFVSKDISSRSTDPVLDLYPRLHNLDPSLFKSNTTYLVCNHIHKFDPSILPHYQPQPTDQCEEGGKKLSFLIPPSSFDGKSDDEGREEESLLVVTCEVMEVSMLPLVAATA